MSPFGESQKEGKENGTDQEPRGDFHMDHQSPCDRPEDEAEGNGQDIQNDYPLQKKDVEEHEKKIDQSRNSKTRVQKIRKNNSGCRKGDAEPHRPLRTETPRCDRSLRLSGMPPILFQIDDVIQEIDRTGEETEEKEGKKSFEEERRIKKVFGEEETGEENEIFCPLFRAEGEKKRDHEIYG